MLTNCNQVIPIGILQSNLELYYMHSYNILLGWTIVVNLIIRNAAIIAYNCSHSEVTSSEFALINLSKCPSFEKHAVEYQQHVQLLQRREFKDVYAYSARVTRTLHIQPCGGGAVTYRWTQRAITLTNKEVLQMHERKIYAIQRAS